MVGVVPWNEVFKKEIFVTLYWYLFNKPDYQSHIVEEMEKLKKSFDMPKSVADIKNIGRYLKEMEKYNLIGRLSADKIKEYALMEEKEIDKTRRVYYQALSFFYTTLFCIKTPNSVGENIKAHSKEYKKYIKDPRIAEFSYPSEVILSFKSSIEKPIAPTQEFLQECSLRPEKFMKMILLQKRIDYIILYRLIIKAFKEIEMIHEIVSDFSSDIGESFPLYEPYSLYYKVPQMLDGDKAIKKCKSYKRSKFILENELEDKRLRARRTWKRIKELLDFYIKIERGTLSFNEKTWRFE